MAADASAFKRLLDSDLGYSFRRSPVAMTSFVLLVVLMLTAFLAPWISPQDPHDLKQLFIDKAELPPIWAKDGEWPFLLGTDPQGRDVLSAILYGTRISLIIGLAAVAVSMRSRVGLGPVSSVFRWVSRRRKGRAAIGDMPSA